MSESRLPIQGGLCPVCGAVDAFVDQTRDGAEYYVECVNCKVYRATRRAFRLFEYLRGRGDRESIARLERLAAVLGARTNAALIRLEYDTWESLTT